MPTRGVNRPANPPNVRTDSPEKPDRPQRAEPSSPAAETRSTNPDAERLSGAASDPINVASREAARTAAAAAGGRAIESSPAMVHARGEVDAVGAGQATSGAGWFREAAFQTRLDRETRSQETPGNAVKLLINGVQSQAQRVENIEDADMVFLKTYNFRNDETGNQMRDLLIERARAGKKVFVQYDAKGYSRRPLGHILDGLNNNYELPPQMQQLKDAGVHVIPSNVGSLNPIYGKDHEKYLLTFKLGEPGRLIMGGMNVGDEWAMGGDPNARVEALHGHHGFRDTDVELQGPVVEHALGEFVRDAKRCLGQNRSLQNPVFTSTQNSFLQEVAEVITAEPDSFFPEVGPSRTRLVTNLPEGGNDAQHIKKLYMELLDRVPAGETVTIFNPFFLPTDDLLEKFKDAANRGVKLQLILNSPESVESGFAVVASGAQAVYRELFRDCPHENLEILEWLDNPAQGCSSFHHKLARFGEEGPIIVGSCNMDYHSLKHNTEGVVLIDNDEVGEQFDAMLKKDLETAELRRVEQPAVEDDSELSRLKARALRKLRWFL